MTIFILQIQGGDPTGTGSGGKSIWNKPFRDECNPKLQHTLEINSPYVPYGGYVHPRMQTKWEDLPQLPPEISKQKQREKFHSFCLSLLTANLHSTENLFYIFA